MRSMWEIINLAVDGVITTKEQAAALVAHEAAEISATCKIGVDEAKARLLEQIGYVTGYFSHKQADRIMELFDTQHPIFGRQHPSAEDAFRMGQEYAQKRNAKKEND
jgi:hypothetical protein